MERKVTKSSFCRAQDSGAFRHTFAANRSYVDVLSKKAMSVERQTKELFPMQRRLCKQRRSTVATIRSCPARHGVCGTCGEVIMYAKRKKTPPFFRTRALIFCCYSFGASSSAFAAAFGASASAAGTSAFASASAAGAAAVSSSTTDCCTNCSFSSAVRI